MHEIKQAFAVLGLVHPIAVNPELIADLLLPGGGMPMVFLKQFPDVNGSWDSYLTAEVQPGQVKWSSSGA